MLKRSGMNTFRLFITLFCYVLCGVSLRAQTMFEARFETPGSLAADVGTLTLTGGNFSQVAVDGQHPSIDWESGAAFFDRPSNTSQPPYSAILEPVAAIPLAGACLSFDYCHRRSQSTNQKSHYLTAYDSQGRIVFQVKLLDNDDDLANALTPQRYTVAYLDSVFGESLFTSSQIQEGSKPESNPLGDNQFMTLFGRESSDTSVTESLAARFQIMTSESGWSLQVSPFAGANALPAFTTTELPFHNPAVSNIATVVITGESGQAGGFWDNLVLSNLFPQTVTLTTTDVEPSTNLAIAHSASNSFTTITDADGGASHRGQSFQIPLDLSPDAPVWNVDTLTVVSQAERDLSTSPDAEISLWLFEMPNASDPNNLSEWNNLDGVSDGDPFDGSGVTNFIFNRATVPANVSLNAGTHLQFHFSPSLRLNPGRAYGFLLALDDKTTETSANIRLRVFRDNSAPLGESYPNGKFLGIGASSNSAVQNSDDLSFFLQARSGSANNPIVINPLIPAGPTIQRWGWDLKGSNGLTDTTAEALRHYAEVPSNLIRIPFYCDAHYSDGSVVTSRYSRILTSLSNILALNPDVEIFASLRLEGGTTFVGPDSEPDWITAGSADWPFDSSGRIFGNQSNRPNPDFYSQMIADFVDYMSSQGITIDYLGVNNETDGALGTNRYIATVDQLKSRLVTRGYDLSSIKFIAPEAFNPNDSVSLIGSLATENRLDTFDIVGSHSYPDRANHTRDLWPLMKNGSGGGKDLWHTEVHINPANNNNGSPPEENITRMRQALAVAFSANLAGVDSFVWWQGGNNTTQIDDTIKRRVIQSALYAYPVLSPPFDEQDPEPDNPFYQAFLNHDTLFIWIANPGEGQPDATIQLGEGFVDLSRALVSEYWSGPGNAITEENSGSLAIAIEPDGRSLQVAIPENSISLLEIPFRTIAPATFATLFASLDPDGDENQNGLSNYFDYASGFDPSSKAAPSAPSALSFGASPDWQHSVRLGSEDVFVDYFYTTSLAEDDWQPLPEESYDLLETELSTERALRSLVLDADFISDKPKLFLRYEFSANP
ncbi:MAG: hypothetical protein Q7Q71_05030 [Verrucomicrobiota bacterium JB023]|nr:hypothetical protein [Verrucomicrobiota bacterium JB023]